MRFTKFLPFISVALLIVSCYLPWMTIESKNITITGVDTTGTSFGKPGYFHFVWAALYFVFFAIPKVWAKRTAIGFAAFNIAFAFRNFLLLPACQMGDCPQKKIGLYLLLFASIAMFAAILTHDKKKYTITQE
jgi:predicted membrane-bound spermidine synthase